MNQQILCPNCLSQVEEGSAACPYCAQAFAGVNPAGCLPYGTVLGGRYTVGRYIMADGEGLLYRAVENSASVRVLIKEYYPVTLSDARWEDRHIEPKQGSEVLFKTNRMDFADMYRALMRITPASGLVAVLDVLEENNTAYAVLEQVNAMPLEQYLSLRGGVLDADEAKQLMQPVLQGVAALHKAGLIHRGIAPGNIFVVEGGVACLGGYATLALRTAGSELKSQLYEGYSAPEQYSAAEFEGRYTDVYGLGAVFYRLLTGTTPMSAAQRKIADNQRSAHQTDAAVPIYLSDVLAASMRLTPAERVQNVPELIGALRSQSQADAMIRRDKQRVRSNEKKNDHRTLIAAMLVIIFILAFLLLWALLGWQQSRQPSDSQSVASLPVSPQEVKLMIPNFVGMSFDHVVNNPDYLANFSFTSTEEYSADVPKGSVIRQEPSAGSYLSNNDSRLIRLYISKGPQLTVMPNIIGFTKENASAELTAAGIRFSMVTLPNDGQYVSDCVVEASVEPNEEIDVSTVIVTVYIASDRAMPAPETSFSTEQKP